MSFKRLLRRVLGAKLGASPDSADKRASVRMDTLVRTQWRLAPGGTGVGEYLKASVRDISRGGCSLISNRPLGVGTLIEVRLFLRVGIAPTELLAEVLRSEVIAGSGRQSHGLRFLAVRRQEDEAIAAYINRKQSELRHRGLA